MPVCNTFISRFIIGSDWSRHATGPRLLPAGPTKYTHDNSKSFRPTSGRNKNQLLWHTIERHRNVTRGVIPRTALKLQ